MSSVQFQSHASRLDLTSVTEIKSLWCLPTAFQLMGVILFMAFNACLSTLITNLKTRQLFRFFTRLYRFAYSPIWAGRLESNQQTRVPNTLIYIKKIAVSVFKNGGAYGIRTRDLCRDRAAS